MARGGPVYFGDVGSNFIEARNHALAMSRARLNEGLRIQKEMRINDEAIAREALNMRRAQALGEQAQAELQLLQQREQQINASPGKPYQRGAATMGQIFDAQERLADATQRLNEHKEEVQRLLMVRDDRVSKMQTSRGGLPGLFGGTKDITKLPGGPEGGASPGATPFGDNPYKTVRREAEEQDVRDKPEALKAIQDEQAQLSPDKSTSALRMQQSQRARLHGLEEREREGEAKQVGINEDERNKQLYSLQERETVLKREALDSEGAIAAAAQEMAARQREQQFIASQPNPYGHQGGGGILGLIGSLFSKAGGQPGQGGGMGGGTSPTPPIRPPTPQPQMRPPTPQPPARPMGQGAPTIKQALGAALQHPMMNAPVTSIVPAIKQLLGGPMSQQMARNPGATMPSAAGAQSMAPMPPPRPQMGPTYGAQVPPVRPRFDQPQMPPMNTGAYNPVTTQSPGVAMQGRGGGGTPQSSDLLIQKYFQPQYQDMARRVTAGESASGRRTLGDKGSSFGDFQLHEGGIAPGGNRVAGWGDDFFRDTGLHASDPSTREAQYKWVANRVAKEGGFKPGIFHAMNQPGFNRGGAPKPSGPVGRQYAAQTSTTPYSGGGGETSPQPQQQQPQQQAAQQPRQLESPEPGPPLKYSPQSSAQMASQGPQGAGQGPQRPNVGAPTIHNEQELAGLKPGSIFRTPDGRLKIVPMPPPQRQQAQPSYAGE